MSKSMQAMAKIYDSRPYISIKATKNSDKRDELGRLLGPPILDYMVFRRFKTLYDGKYLGRRKLKKLFGPDFEKRCSHFLLAAMIEPGDIFHTCEGINRTVKEVFTEVRNRRGRKFVVDFEIVSDDGGSHSWTHCCSPPLESRHIQEDFVSLWTSKAGFDLLRKWSWPYTRPMLVRFVYNEKLLDEFGRPTELWKYVRGEKIEDKTGFPYYFSSNLEACMSLVRQIHITDSEVDIDSLRKSLKNNYKDLTEPERLFIQELSEYLQHTEYPELFKAV